MTSAFEAYVMFNALKQHFTSSYDYFKYNGKIRANKERFDSDKTRFFFEKLAKKKDCLGLIVSNFISRGTKLWIRDLLDDKSDEIYLQWKAKQESLSYNFKNELDALDDDFDSNIKFNPDETDCPKIVKLFYDRQISIETLIILNDFCNFFPYLNKKIIDPYWKSIYIMCEKYKPFLHYDKDKFKQIVLARFT
jgi:hypothetical protein